MTIRPPSSSETRGPHRATRRRSARRPVGPGRSDGAAGTYCLAAFPSAARTFVAHTWGQLLQQPEQDLRVRLTECEPQDALAAHDWVLPHERWSCHEMAQRACALAGFSPHRVAQASDFSVLLQLVAVGAGVALVPQLTVATLPEGVHLHRLKSPIFRHDFVVTRSPAQPDPGIQRLKQSLQASARSVLAQKGPVRQQLKATKGTHSPGDRVRPTPSECPRMTNDQRPGDSPAQH